MLCAKANTDTSIIISSETRIGYFARRKGQIHNIWDLLWWVHNNLKLKSKSVEREGAGVGWERTGERN